MLNALRSRLAQLPLPPFRPCLLRSLRTYDRAHFTADLSAGVTVGVVALPLAMAFGIASGVKPEAGIFTAIIAGFLISALGGSRVQIGGPAGAFVALLYAIVERYGVANLLIATIMAGVLLFAMGALRLGQLIRYIPVSIVIGFTNGIAVIVGMQQLKDFLGLSIDKMPANFFSQVGALAAHLHTIDVAAFALGVGIARADRRLAQVVQAERRALAPLDGAAAGHDRRARDRRSSRSRCSACRSTRSAAASAASRRGCRRSRCRPSSGRPRRTSSGRRSRSRCSARSSRCSARASPTR